MHLYGCECECIDEMIVGGTNEKRGQHTETERDRGSEPVNEQQETEWGSELEVELTTTRLEKVIASPSSPSLVEELGSESLRKWVPLTSLLTS